MTTKISVCLVDDQTLVRQGIRSLLQLSDDIAVIAEAADGAQAVATIPQAKPDVVLLDMRMPGMSGLDVLNALAAKNELPPTIILTTFDDDQLVLSGLKAGARGYLLKDVSLEQLVEAVRVVAGGGSLVAPMVTQRLLAGVGRMQNQFTSLEQPDPLTERETEILRLLSGGYSNKEIANSLKVAEGTVKNHVSNILSKLGVRDRTRAAKGAGAGHRLSVAAQGDHAPADAARNAVRGLENPLRQGHVAVQTGRPGPMAFRRTSK